MKKIMYQMINKIIYQMINKEGDSLSLEEKEIWNSSA